MKYSHGNPLVKEPLSRSILLALAVLAGICLLVWFGVEQWYQTSLEPRAQTAEEVIFPVNPGMSTIDIADELEQQELIRSATAFIWYLNRQDSETALQAGTYRLRASLSTPEIADMLIKGQVDTSLLTIPPGLRLDEMLEKVFVPAGFSAAEVERAFAARYTVDILTDKPSQASLEGYIYPETFQITEDSTVESIIQRAIEEMSAQVTPTIRQGIKKQGLTMHEAVILASIIQEEASDTEDQRKVAQVFLSRLEKDMSLGADATFRYAAEIEGVEASPELDSPYNTRQVSGLPPGPIANFNLSALEAVANPADTDFLYFVHGDDCSDPNSTTCTTYFARTAEQHEANVEKYCVEYCQF